MTILLEKAIKKVNELSDKEQNEIAEIIIEELEDEKRWSISFKNSQDKLAELADEALEEFQKVKMSAFIKVNNN